MDVRHRAPCCLITAALLFAAAPSASRSVVANAEGSGQAQSRGATPSSVTSAWFGLPLPPQPGSRPAVVTGTRGPRPVTVPPDEPALPELQAAVIRADLEQIVGIATESQKTREIGSGQLWGRTAEKLRATITSNRFAP